MNYIKVFTDFVKVMEVLSDAEKGRLFMAMLEYAETGEAPDLRGNERIVWPYASLQVDKNSGNDSRGKDHWNWKGGITPKNQIDRNSREAREWRKKVFERDNYTCVKCGRKGGRLNAHHKHPWAKFPNERFNIDNGCTLCKDCHKKLHRG